MDPDNIRENLEILENIATYI